MSHSVRLGLFCYKILYAGGQVGHENLPLPR